MDKKVDVNEWEERLSYEAKSAWDKYSRDDLKEVFSFSEDYKLFLDNAKTEREAVEIIVKWAQENRFQSLDELIKNNPGLKPGDRIYVDNKGKGVILAVIGKQDISKGVRVIGAHLDAPRLDLKQNPLYEDEGLAMLKTQYYGGIKKYQWLMRPLALYGVVINSKGEKLKIVIGEKEDDPVFTITDLLPHLAKDQMDKKLRDAIPGESLNVLVGSIPVDDKDVKKKVKYTVLKYLWDNYEMVEEDFISAEFELVPAGKARDIGFDKALVGAYGQDDRVCSYATIRAINEIKEPEFTSIALLVDKEEIGSNGNTGMQGSFFINVIAELIGLSNHQYNELNLRRCLALTKGLSADVNAGLDPNFIDVLDKLNAARIGYGLVITKYTGSGGKYSANDANAEFVGEVRNLFNGEGVVWQTGALGKVDQGGGGTIAQFMAQYGMEVLDCGVALLGMHAPMEVASKADIYEAYKGYKAFFNLK
jgi:aspartyl aminopeptidase